jgi:hypothetical protein
MWDIEQCHDKQTCFWKTCFWNLGAISKDSLSKSGPAQVGYILVVREQTNPGVESCSWLLGSQGLQFPWWWCRQICVSDLNHGWGMVGWLPNEPISLLVWHSNWFSIYLLQILETRCLHYMTFGKVWQHAEYSYGAWESSAHQSNTIQRACKNHKNREVRTFAFKCSDLGPAESNQCFLLARTPASVGFP